MNFGINQYYDGQCIELVDKWDGEVYAIVTKAAGDWVGQCLVDGTFIHTYPGDRSATMAATISRVKRALKQLWAEQDAMQAAELRAEYGYERQLDYRASFDDPRGW